MNDKKIMEIEQMIISAYTEKPELISNNNVLWAYISQGLANHYGINTIEEFVEAIVYGKIPSSHSLAAAISNVRKEHPQFVPTEEQRQLKEQVKQNYINRYNQI
jgi:hypothetical protein